MIVKMASTTFLQIPGTAILKRRRASASDPKERYGSVGGLVDIRELSKRYETSKKEVPKQKSTFFNSFSPRSRASSVTTDDSEIHSNGSLPQSPYRSEGWMTPDTPQTPATPCRQTFTSLACQKHNSTPPLSKFNRYGRELCLTLSPDVLTVDRDLPERPADDITPTQRLLAPPIELPGSLLLPSQGFPQSNPPAIPPRQPLPNRSHSAPLDTRTIDHFIVAEETSAMAKSSHTQNRSRIVIEGTQNAPYVPPPRQSSLPVDIAQPPQHHPPPVPLSQMTMEELMQVLPTLNAAIIAHDWVPCMQKRQNELKTWLQRHRIDQQPNEDLKHLNKASLCMRRRSYADYEQDLTRLIHESKDVATTYRNLFSIANGLQNESLKMKADELDEANAQKSEAIIALAKHASMHNESCAKYEREMAELKDKTCQGVNVLRTFIRDHLGESLQRVTHDELQAVLDVFVEVDKGTNCSSTYVRSEIYQDLQISLENTSIERDGLREICTEQINTIKKQSKDLDEYISRMAKIISLVQEKEQQNQNLKWEVAELQQRYQTHQNDDIETKHNKQKDQEIFQSNWQRVYGFDGIFDNEVSARDAEISNLRRKLEKAYGREKELQNQIRRLLQNSQTEHNEKPPSRLRRLLGGPQKIGTSIPSPHSMQNLSHSVLSASLKQDSQLSMPPSSARSGRTSPSLAALCDPALVAVDNCEPQRAPYKASIRTGSSKNVAHYNQQAIPSNSQDEIETAVSGRFHQGSNKSNRQMSIETRSPNSVSRPHTPQSSRKASLSDTISEQSPRPQPNQQLGSVNFNVNTASSPPVNQEPYHTDPEDDFEPLLIRQPRILSGITEVTEDGGSSMKRASSNSIIRIGGETGSPNSAARRMFVDDAHTTSMLG